MNSFAIVYQSYSHANKASWFCCQIAVDIHGVVFLLLFAMTVVSSPTTKCVKF